MEIIKKLQEELNEIEKIKEENKYLKADKKRMSEKLYEFMIKEYENQSYKERVEKYKKDCCKDCCYRFYGCEITLPNDILKPFTSIGNWDLSVKGCKNFKWS